MSYIGQEPNTKALTASDIADDLITSAKLNYAETTLTDGATVSWDASTADVAKVTLGGNRTLAAPTNGTTGQFISLLIIQDGTGSRTLTWNAVFEFASDTAPTLTTTALTASDIADDLITSAKLNYSESTLTDQATVTWDASTQDVCKLTLGGNRTMAAPTNNTTGQFISILVIQDGTGSRTLTWNAVFEFASDTAPTLTTTASLGDVFVFRYNGSKWLEVGRNQALTLS